FFNGLSEDDLLRPMHLNFKWFGLEPLPTFLAYDVMKNPEIENDFKRFHAHLVTHFRNS
ncbi:MAG: flavodoxin family protein, partial [Bacteroidota bacterium]